jgi:hypothetical protein
MKKKLPWLKYDMLKKEFIEVILEKEKTAKKKMEEAAKILEDSKKPIEYVPCFLCWKFIVVHCLVSVLKHKDFFCNAFKFNG